MNKPFTTMAPHLQEQRRLENARGCARYFAGLILRKMSKDQVRQLYDKATIEKLDIRAATIEELDKSIKIFTEHLGIKQFNK